MEKFGIHKNSKSGRYASKRLLCSNCGGLTLKDLIVYLEEKAIDPTRISLNHPFTVMVDMPLKKPIKDRLRINVDGITQRIDWVAKFRPEILLRMVCMTHTYPSNSDVTKSAIFSSFAKLGLRREELHALILEHPEWEINVRVFDQM